MNKNFTNLKEKNFNFFCENVSITLSSWVNITKCYEYILKILQENKYFKNCIINFRTLAKSLRNLVGISVQLYLA